MMESLPKSIGADCKITLVMCCLVAAGYTTMIYQVHVLEKLLMLVTLPQLLILALFLYVVLV